MSAILAAFAEYFVKLVVLVAAAVVGAICGNKIHEKRKREGKLDKKKD